MDAEAYVDMLPWLVFIVVDRRTGLGAGWGGACGAVTGVALVMWAFFRGRRAPVPCLAVGLFGACTVGAVMSPWWAAQVSAPRALTVLALGVAALLSVGSIGIRPLSETYTATHVGPRARRDARFDRVNVQITRAWAVGALLAAASYGLASFAHDDVALTLLNWIVPLAITGGTVLWAGRRWELFRLEVDSASSPDATTGRVLGAMQASASHDTKDAVIHPLPERRRQHI